MDTELKAQLDRIEEKLDKLLNSKPKSSENTANSGEQVLKGIVAYPEIKQGAKARFLTFKLKATSKGDVSCKTFDGNLLDDIIDDAEIEVKGEFQEWKGYSNFNVKQILSRNDSPTSNNTNETTDDDDVPF